MRSTRKKEIELSINVFWFTSILILIATFPLFGALSVLPSLINAYPNVIDSFWTVNSALIVLAVSAGVLLLSVVITVA